MHMIKKRIILKAGVTLLSYVLIHKIQFDSVHLDGWIFVCGHVSVCSVMLSDMGMHMYLKRGCASD